MTNGKFITFEGNEGAGKSTLIEGIALQLRELNYHVEVTREPGGITIAEKIRDILLDKENKQMDLRTEALLFAAARRQHLVEKIKPALTEGKIVLCDRFIDSSLAYQGFARNIGIDAVLDINQFAIEDTFPDVTIFIDIHPEDGLRRIEREIKREVNRLDLEEIAFHQRVREGYLEVMKRFPNRIVRVNGDQSKESVVKETIAIILEKIK